VASCECVLRRFVAARQQPVLPVLAMPLERLALEPWVSLPEAGLPPLQELRALRELGLAQERK
jgi:hypothetical protein